MLQTNPDGSEEMASDGDMKLELGRELLLINGNRCAATLENAGFCPCPSFPRAFSLTPSFMPGGPAGSHVQSWPLPRAGCVSRAELLTARSTSCCDVLRTRSNQLTYRGQLDLAGSLWAETTPRCCWWYIPQLQPLLVLLTCFCAATSLNALLTHGKELHLLFQTALVPLPHMPAAQFVSPAFDALLPPVHQPSLLAGSSVLGGRNSFGDAHGHFTGTQKPCDCRQGRQLLKVHLAAQTGRRKPLSCGLGSAQFVF